ncbi:MAG TPA: hypothetical protein PK916_04690 [Bacteroidota bacterium]|nr:hypothetical protein [Bacteroidota bacterium]
MTRSELIAQFIQAGMIPADTLSQLGEDNNATVGAAMDSAIVEFSQDSPRQIDHTGTLTSDHRIELSEWTHGSAILFVEHPTGGHPRTFVPSNDRVIDESTGILTIPHGQSGAGFKVRYTAPHSIDETAETVTLASGDLPPFRYLTLAYLFDAVAAHHAESVQSMIGADSVSHTTKTDTYLKLKESARNTYRMLLRLPERKEARHASAVVPLRTPRYRHFPDTY